MGVGDGHSPPASSRSEFLRSSPVLLVTGFALLLLTHQTRCVIAQFDARGLTAWKTPGRAVLLDEEQSKGGVQPTRMAAQPITLSNGLCRSRCVTDRPAMTRTCPVGPRAFGEVRRWSAASRGLVDQGDDPREHVRIGLGQDAVAEVEDVPGRRGALTEHSTYVGLDDRPGR
jgi:hypothetical protein